MIFNEKDTFQKERPKGITDLQRQNLIKKLAGEIIDNGWSDSKIEVIITDLDSLSAWGAGFKLAKELDSNAPACRYRIDADFIEWLDDFGIGFTEIKFQNLKAWVSAHNVKPKFAKGQKLKIKNKIPFFSGFFDTIYINSIDRKHALYYVGAALGNYLNAAYDFEDIENNCEILKD